MLIDPNAATAKLAELKVRAERGKTERTRAETTLEQLALQDAQLLKECAELGVTPDALDAEIAKCDAEYNKHIAEAERLLVGVV